MIFLKTSVILLQIYLEHDIVSDNLQRFSIFNIFNII